MKILQFLPALGQHCFLPEKSVQSELAGQSATVAQYWPQKRCLRLVSYRQSSASLPHSMLSAHGSQKPLRTLQERVSWSQ
ncbi:MAG: hypothetical protein QM765_14625 [Myxococcales bacterium]